MSRYVVYNPDQDVLLPASVREELGERHLAVFVHQVVERLDLGEFEAEHAEAGRPSYRPQLLLKVWLYAYALGLASSRRIEQRLHEDLGFRYLAGGWKPDYWTLNQFRRRHPKKLNDVFPQVLEAARKLGLAQLGRVAVDSTRVEANASPDKSQSRESLRCGCVRHSRSTSAVIASSEPAPLGAARPFLADFPPRDFHTDS